MTWKAVGLCCCAILSESCIIDFVYIPSHSSWALFVNKPFNQSQILLFIAYCTINVELNIVPRQ